MLALNVGGATLRLPPVAQPILPFPVTIVMLKNRTLSQGMSVLKLEELLNDPLGHFRLSNRHIVALVNLSAQVGIQGRTEIGQGGQRSIVTSRVQIDRTADPDAVAECAEVGLALRVKGFVTVSSTVQEALTEWLDATAFPDPAHAIERPRPEK